MTTTLIKIQIKSILGRPIFEYEKEGNTIKETVAEAIKQDANLRDANLSGANLSGANLSPIKNDFFVVLLHSIPEIGFLEKNIIDGKIDGSTYDGECACLSGTLVNGAKITDGDQEEKVINNIMSCRDAERPIERLFLGIKKGDIPETNPISKIVLEWLIEFKNLIKTTA